MLGVFNIHFFLLPRSSIRRTYRTLLCSRLGCTRSDNKLHYITSCIVANARGLKVSLKVISPAIKVFLEISSFLRLFTDENSIRISERKPNVSIDQEKHFKHEYGGRDRVRIIIWIKYGSKSRSSEPPPIFTGSF